MRVNERFLFDLQNDAMLNVLNRISQRLQNEYELARVNEPSVLEPSVFYCTFKSFSLK